MGINRGQRYQIFCNPVGTVVNVQLMDTENHAGVKTIAVKPPTFFDKLRNIDFDEKVRKAIRSLVILRDQLNIGVEDKALARREAAAVAQDLNRLMN